MIVSETVFIWFCTIMTAGLSGAWIFVALCRLRRALRDDVSRAPVRDRVFGSMIGIAVAVVGLVGMLRWHDVL